MWVLLRQEPDLYAGHFGRAWATGFWRGLCCRFGQLREFRLGEKSLDDLSRNVGKPVVTTIEPISQPFVVDAHQMQDSGV